MGFCCLFFVSMMNHLRDDKICFTSHEHLPDHHLHSIGYDTFGLFEKPTILEYRYVQ